MLTNNSQDNLIKGVMKHGPDILEKCLVDPNELIQYLTVLDREHLDYPIPLTEINPNNWLIPNEYKDLDIESWLVNNCPKENHERLVKELTLYREQKFIPVLKAMKYIVDTLRENNVVWGVGRGSSVASYALYLIGVHKIDSIKYNIPIEEFFKGETNG
jgi:DNA polymerase III alpha subunit